MAGGFEARDRGSDVDAGIVGVAGGAALRRKRQPGFRLAAALSVPGQRTPTANNLLSMRRAIEEGGYGCFSTTMGRAPGSRELLLIGVIDALESGAHTLTNTVMPISDSADRQHPLTVLGKI